MLVLGGVNSARRVFYLSSGCGGGLELKAPIFVVGSGRSGTTLLYEILASHGDLAWVCNLTNRLPFLPQISSLCRSQMFRKHRAFKPAMEAIKGFEYCGVSRFNPPMDLRYAIENPEVFDLRKVTEKTQDYFQKHCDGFNCDRFVSKNTANSMRIELLNSIFPDAYYVHITRNPYSVVSSLLNVKFWPDLHLWWNEKTPLQLENDGGNKYEIAGTHWTKQIEQIIKAKQLVPGDRFLDVSYEELVTNSVTVVENIFDFCCLDFSKDTVNSLTSLNINSNSLEKWKTVDYLDNYKAANPAIRSRAIELGYELL